MTISSELTKLQTNLTNAYTAIDNKGGTIPANQNFDNLATCIGTISGSGYSEFPPYQVSNGVISRKSGALTGNEFSGITSVGDYGLYYAFYNCVYLTGVLDLSLLTSVGFYGLFSAFRGCTGLTSVNLSLLTTASGYSCLNYTFYGCSGLTSIDLSSLTTVSGTQGLYSAFNNCTSLTSIDLSSLTTVSGSQGLYGAFQNCTSLTSVDFPSLTTVSNNSGLQKAFGGCTGLTDVYFRALTTTSFGDSYINQFNNIMQSTGTTTTHTLHFPSNLQSTISGLEGYPLFGGTSGYVVLAFDLPATS